MTNNEIKLIKMIREQDNPERAIMTSLKVILSYLAQHESSEEPSVDYFQELA